MNVWSSVHYRVDEQIDIFIHWEDSLEVRGHFDRCKACMTANVPIKCITKVGIYVSDQSKSRSIK